MDVGGIYFIDHKTKDYFPEGAGLLNLPVSTLNEWKNHDSQLFTGDTHLQSRRLSSETPSRHTTTQGRPLKVP